MIDTRNVRLPTYFEQVKEDNLSEDSRFKKVKIYVAHTGENLNNSVFSREALEDMAKTLPYIPILGYIQKGEDNSDFGGHEKQYKLEEDGTLEISFNTHAYGFVGEDNEATIETTGGKEWLVCYGYLWTRFIDSINIFNESGEIKGQSMEISDVDGYVDDLGRVVYTKATFQGLCILGDDKIPAMTGSTISTMFTKENLKNTLREMFEEFSIEKGVEVMAKTKKEETTEDEESKKSVDTSKQTEKGDDVEKTNDKNDDKKSAKDSETTDKDKKKKDFEENPEKKKDKDKGEDLKEDKSDEGTDPKDENTSDKEADVKDKKKQKNEFELSLEDLRTKLQEALSESFSHWVYICSTFDDYVIVETDDFVSEVYETKYFKVDYTKGQDDVIQVDFDNKVEVFPIFATAQEKEDIEANRQKVAELQEQLNNLIEYKNGAEMSAKEKIVSEVESKLESKQIDKIKSQFSVLSVEDVEKEVAYAIYQTEKHSVNAATAFTRHIDPAANKNKKSKYGELDRYFTKKDV